MTDVWLEPTSKTKAKSVDSPKTADNPKLKKTRGKIAIILSLTVSLERILSGVVSFIYIPKEHPLISD